MKINKESILFYQKNWKMFLHLLLSTNNFGVNNEWWDNKGSFFGLPLYKIIWRIITIRPLIVEYQKIKFRAIACHFMDDKEKEIVGWTTAKYSIQSKKNQDKWLKKSR